MRAVPNLSTAYLFPTFPMRDVDAGADRIPGYGEILDGWTARAAKLIPIPDDLFAVPDPSAIPDLQATLNAHHACYLEELAMAEWLSQTRGPADVVSGYSMGLFAALCWAESMAFEDGLAVMSEVCRNVHRVGDGKRYSMGVVSGLDELAVKSALVGSVEVTDIYSPTTLILAGLTEEVAASTAACSSAGAEDTMLLPVSAPFHSTALGGVRSGNETAVAEVRLQRPVIPVISAVTAGRLDDVRAVRAELVGNVATPMRWFDTMVTLMDAGVDTFYECGLSQRLVNVARRMIPEGFRAENFLDFEEQE